MNSTKVSVDAPTFLLIALLVSVFAGTSLAQTEGFESGMLPAGSTIGDALIITGPYGDINPSEGNRQLLMTTINNTSDSPTTNQSGADAVPVTQVANHVGAAPGVIRFDPSHQGFEGSAFVMTLSLTAGEIITFDWDFLTAENPFSSNPNEDFGFAYIAFDTGSGFTQVDYEVLGNQTTATNMNATTTPFFNETGTMSDHFSTYAFQVTQDGTYSLGIGVMDGRNATSPSGLLVDNIAVVPEPSAIALAFAGMTLLIGLQRFRNRR